MPGMFGQIQRRCNMKTFYLIKGFEKKSQVAFIPDPGLFETEEEASIYCNKYSCKHVVLGYSPVRLGKMEVLDIKEK